MPSRMDRRRSAVAEINITPLIDVMLVILIIFMVLAPSVQHGVEVEVPEATIEPIESKEQHIVVSITKNGELFVRKAPVELDILTPKLKAIFKNNPDKQIYFEADKTVPYGRVMEVMASIRRAGITNISMITEPEK